MPVEPREIGEVRSARTGQIRRMIRPEAAGLSLFEEPPPCPGEAAERVAELLRPRAGLNRVTRVAARALEEAYLRRTLQQSV